MTIVSRQPIDPSPRIAAPSVLPVFLDLTGKRAIVAGGTEGAGWKVELLVAAGAKVDVYAGDVSGSMGELIARHPKICHVSRRWRAENLPGAAVALRHAKTEQETATFVACFGRSMQRD